MIFTIISKNYGTQKINTDTFNPGFAATGSTIFKVVEHIFNDWYETYTQPGAPFSRDIPGMYFGEADQPAIYTVKGAIRDGIAILIECALEEKKQVLTTRQIQNFDIECAFL